VFAGWFPGFPAPPTGRGIHPDRWPHRSNTPGLSAQSAAPGLLGGRTSEACDLEANLAVKCVLIDDDDVILKGLSLYLRQSGHDVFPFTDGPEALGFIHDRQDVELVVADVGLPGMDGFRVALRVMASLGSAPPRTLLISGDDHDRRLDGLSPALVIALVRKPFSFSAFARLLAAIQATRNACPGMLARFCVWGYGFRNPSPHAVPAGVPCRTPHYSECPYYDSGCGRRFRDWIHNSADWQDWPACVSAS
jgi:CheY-like chemotaxis protein